MLAQIVVTQPEQNPRWGNPSLPPAALAGKGDMTLILTACYNLVFKAATNPIAARKQTWFGNSGATRSADIDSRAAKIQNFIRDSNRTIYFVCAVSPGSIASYAQYQKEKVDGGLPLNQCKKDPRIILGDGFRSGAYSWGDKVISILHEISHMTIGTLDQQVGAPARDAYGAEAALELREDNHQDAFRNADNWAYYFGSYHGDIVGQTGKAWTSAWQGGQVDINQIA